jgi:preprotein translocase subunit YajC
MIIVVYLVILVAAFFVLVVRPQRRQMATHRALVSTLTPGDEIVTSGGILGTIRDLDEETVNLEVAPTVVIRVARGAIARRVKALDDTPPTSGDRTTDDGDTA